MILENFHKIYHCLKERVIMKTLIIFSLYFFVLVKAFDSDKIRNQSCDWNTHYPEGYLSVKQAPVPECQASCYNGK